MKRINIFPKLLLVIFSIIVSGIITEAEAQVVYKPEKKKSTSVIFSPRQKKSTPVIITNTRNLPPGHAKKVYGEKSAKRFAPGQRKKVQSNDWLYNQDSKHKGKKQHKANKNK